MIQANPPPQPAKPLPTGEQTPITSRFGLGGMARAGWRGRHGKIAIYRSFEKGVDEARKAFE